MKKPANALAELDQLKRKTAEEIRRLKQRLDRAERRHAEYSLAMSYTVRCLVDLLAQDQGLKAAELAAVILAARAHWLRHDPSNDIETLLRNGLKSLDMDKLLEFLTDTAPGPRTS